MKDASRVFRLMSPRTTIKPHQEYIYNIESPFKSYDFFNSLYSLHYFSFPNHPINAGDIILDEITPDKVYLDEVYPCEISHQIRLQAFNQTSLILRESVKHTNSIHGI